MQIPWACVTIAVSRGQQSAPRQREQIQWPRTTFFTTSALALLAGLVELDETLIFTGAALSTLDTPDLLRFVPVDALIMGEGAGAIHELARAGVIRWVDGPTCRDNDADRAAHQGIDTYAVDTFRMAEVFQTA